jgi:predicted phosphodiesterase
MKIRVYSDLHLETKAFRPSAEPCDIVVLAGDIHEGREGIRWARAAFPRVPVVYVAGNHEYYGQSTPELAAGLRQECQDSNVHFLECGAWNHGTLRFLGCTLWTDFALLSDVRGSTREALQRMTDYRQIRVTRASRRFRPEDAIRLHVAAVDWLARMVDEPFDGETVIVTHHAPSAASVPDRYLRRPRAAAYASDLDAFVAGSGARLWIHGHVHERCDYQIGETRVVCNARGIGDECVGQFDPDLTVEV